METKSEDKDKDQKKKVKNSSRFKLSEDLKTIRKIKKILCQRGNASDSISGEGKNKEKKLMIDYGLENMSEILQFDILLAP
jgi:hypothetical protein